MEQGVLVELPPGQLLLPDPDGVEGFLAAGALAGLPGRGPGLARAEGAEGQGRAQRRGARPAGKLRPGS
jgi:hypothetical protein